jgi:hypothetical protein
MRRDACSTSRCPRVGGANDRGVLKNKLYVALKIAKKWTPGLSRTRLLKRSSYTDTYDGRAILEPGEGNRMLLEHILAGSSVTAGKIGDTELEVLVKYESAQGDSERFFRSITDHGHEMDLLHLNCGVFPKRADVMARWAETYLDALGNVDLLAVWHNVGEEEIVSRYAPEATLTRVRGLESFYHETPWTKALAEKRVLVVTPFEETVALQRRRYRGEDLFPQNPDVLPDFDMSIVRSPFSAGLVPPVHSDWHAALDAMKESIRQVEFDVCLVGAGAFSLPLCAFARNELGRTAIHLGGTLQLLFGIRGRRFDEHPVLKTLYNENWIRPLPSERPKGRWRNDGGAYW